MRVLKSFLIASVGIVTASGAIASDLPPQTYRAPAMVSAPAFNWTGFYLGVMGGYVFGTGNINNYSGGLAGGTIGYNYQPIGSAFVFGVEADGGWSNFGDSASVTLGGFTGTSKSEAQAIATLRARFGATFDRTLIYVTGGGAWARNKITLGVTGPGVGISASDTQNHMGYALGAGIEQALSNNWSAKGEYLYTGLGSGTYNLLPFGTLQSGNVNLHTIKVGLNYRF